MSNPVGFKALLEVKREIEHRIDELMGAMDIFPDVYEEYGVGDYEWSPRNETKVLWECKIAEEVGELKAKLKKINRKLGFRGRDVAL